MSLLDDLDDLRQRTRNDRHAYTLPLFLFGALILLSPVLYASTLPQAPGFEMVPVHGGMFPQFTSIGPKYPNLVGWYWVITIIGGLWATSWWYRQRARRHGVETDVRVPTAAAIAALVGFLVWEPLFGTLLSELFDHYGGYSTPAVNLPILFGSAAALLALAWAERSALLAVVGALFTSAALLVNLYDVENVFDRLGWYGGWNDQVSTLQVMLLPGMILLVGGVVAIIRDRR